MKRIAVAVFALLLAPSLFADAGERLIPAGSLISCTLSEPKMSSRNTAVGDPVLCQVSHSERYGRSVMPYNSYLVGRFEDYKDPGHFVGKGWMELRFDRMVIEPDTVIPVNARVVDVPGYRVDSAGRILGKGHAVRDVVLWSLPVLWPIDLVMLPMRGPRPVLKEETRVTLKVMDDLAVPTNEGPQADPYGLMHRQTGDNDMPPPPAEEPAPEPQPVAQSYPQPAPQPVYQQPVYQQPVYAYAAPVVVPPPVYFAPPVVYAWAPPVMVAPPVVYAYRSAPRVYGYGYAPGRYAYAPRAAAGYGYGYGGPLYRSTR